MRHTAEIEHDSSPPSTADLLENKRTLWRALVVVILLRLR